MTLDDVKAVLAPDEPDYGAASALGGEAVPLLIELLNGADEHYASKAASLLGMLGGAQATQALLDAADEPRLSVRIAVAATSTNLADEAREPILVRLLESSEPILRKLALETVPAQRSQRLDQLITRISTHDDLPELKTIAGQLLGS